MLITKKDNRGKEALIYLLNSNYSYFKNDKFLRQVETENCWFLMFEEDVKLILHYLEKDYKILTDNIKKDLENMCISYDDYEFLFKLLQNFTQYSKIFDMLKNLKIINKKDFLKYLEPKIKIIKLIL